MKMSDICFLKTELTSKFKNLKLSFRSSVFKKRTSAVWGRFFTLPHSLLFILQHDRINSQSIFLHTVSLATSESFRVTISWTNSAWKYVISSVIPYRRKWKMASTDECNVKSAQLYSIECIHIKHTVQKPTEKTKTAVNFVKPKPNRKLQFFYKTEPKSFLPTAHP